MLLRYILGIAYIGIKITLLQRYVFGAFRRIHMFIYMYTGYNQVLLSYTSSGILLIQSRNSKSYVCTIESKPDITLRRHVDSIENGKQTLVQWGYNWYAH